ncbi:putative phage holin [Streptomyces olivaceus]
MNADRLISITTSGLAALCAAAFVATYWRLAPWRSTPTGWYLMTFGAAIGGLGAYTVVVTLIDIDGTTATILRLIRSGLMLTVAGLLVQATRMVRRAQHRRTDDGPTPE